MRIPPSCPLAAMVILGVAVALAPRLAGAATLEGTVTLTPADLTFRGGMKANAYIGQLSGAAHAATSDPSDTTYGVAYVSDLTEAPDAGGPVALLDQKGQRFIPRILAVVAGQAVDFRNSDNVFHNVFSYSPPKKFDLGRYPRGKSKRLTFQKPGLVQVFCDIHSDMRADIVVVPSRRFGYIDAEGRFRIEDVPAGRHTVTVWLPRRGLKNGEVDVPENGPAAFAMGAE